MDMEKDEEEFNIDKARKDIEKAEEIIEKGNKIVETIFNRYAEDLAYYNSLSPRFHAAYDDDIREALAVLQRLGQITREYKQIDIANEIDSVFYEEVGRLNLRQ